MKRLVLFVLMISVLFFVPTTVSALEIGDINFQHLDHKVYLETAQLGEYIKNTHTYPEESIKIVQVIFKETDQSVRQVRYLKGDELFVYKSEKPKLPDAQFMIYVRLVNLSLEETTKITAELKSFIDKLAGDKKEG